MVGPAHTPGASDETHWWEDDDVIIEAARAGNDASSADLSIPGYADVRELLRGGQGIVYTALREDHQGRVAVKVLRDDRGITDQDRRRFEREIDVVTRLSHRNIVSVQDSGTTPEGRRFLVMDFIDGSPLDEYVLGDDRAVDRGDDDSAWRFGVRETLTLFVRICDAVQYAHQRGVIHRDLKPGNIRVDETGEPHVLDFGLALAFGEDALTVEREPTLTTTGQFVGSLAWASPEQASGHAGDIDVRTDVYALGLILFYLLTGRMPYATNGTLADLLDNIRYESPVSPGRYRSLEADVEAVVLKCLAKNPVERYQSVRELAVDVRHVLAGEPIEARRASTWGRMQASLVRYRRATFVATTALVVLIGLVAVMFDLYQRAIDAETLADSRLRDMTREARNARRSVDFLQSVFRGIDPSSARDTDPTLRHVLDLAVRRVETDLRDQPEVQADILATLGAAYGNMGDNETAIPLLARSVAIWRGLREESNPQSRTWEQRTSALGSALRSLGLCTHAAGDLGQATTHLEEARRLLGELNATSGTEAVLALVNLGVLEAANGDYERAEHTLRRAVEEGAALGYQPNPWQGEAECRLSQVMAVRGATDEAEQLLIRAEPRLRGFYGSRNVHIADWYYLRSQLRRWQGRYEEGLADADAALELMEALIGPEHRRTLDGLILRSHHLGLLRRYDEALASVDRVIATMESTVGRRQLAVARALESRGFLLSGQARHEEAIETYQESLEIFLEFLPPEHVDVVFVEVQLGCSRVYAGLAADALPALEVAVPALERLLPGDPRNENARACLERARGEIGNDETG